MSQPSTVPPDYLDEENAEFEAGLQQRDWQENTQFGGLVLRGSCPVCGHDGAIDVFVPTVISQFQASMKIDSELVTCACTKNHGAPAGKSGCGRWGYVTPRVGQG